MKKSNIKILETLTKENAHRVSTIINKQCPEWGTKKFNHNVQPLTEGRMCSTHGVGSNQAILFDGCFHFWGVVSFK